MQKIRTIEEMRKLFSDRGYTLLSETYEGNKKPLIFEKDGYKYQNSYNGFIKTDNPKKWGINNPFSIDNLKLFLKRNGIDVEVLSTEYDYNNIILRCKCGEIYSVSCSNLFTKQQFKCPKCGIIQRSIHNRKDEKYLPMIKHLGLEVVGEYIGCKNSTIFKNKSGYYIKTSAYNIVNGRDIESLIYDIQNPYSLDNMKHFIESNCPDVKLLSDKYIGAKERYDFLCSCGKRFQTNWYYFRHSDFKCPTCSKSQSSLESKVEKVLIECGIEYSTEFSFSDCKNIFPLKFDFYLPLQNKIIEADGEQHYRPVTFGGVSQEEAINLFKKAQINDNIKNDYCKVHNIPLLRIKYSEFDTDEYIEKIKTFIS